MSIRSRAENALLVLAILALFGSLIVLISSLDELSFQPGKLLPRSESENEDETVAERTIPPLGPKDQLYASILGLLTLLSIVCVLIFRKLRKLLLQHLFVMFAIVFPLLLGVTLFGKLFSGWFQHHQSDEGVVPGPVIPDSLLTHPPTWAIALAAGAASLVILGLCAFIVIRWLAFRTIVDKHRTEQAALHAQQQAIAEQAAEAASRIRQGKPLEGEVIRCYEQMSRWLSKQRQLKPTYLTPREFADALTMLDIQSEHVIELTGLFELVRYGDRDDRSLADAALQCLDRIRSAYGVEENE